MLKFYIVSVLVWCPSSYNDPVTLLDTHDFQAAYKLYDNELSWLTKFNYWKTPDYVAVEPNDHWPKELCEIQDVRIESGICHIHTE